MTAQVETNRMIIMHASGCRIVTAPADWNTNPSLVYACISYKKHTKVVAVSKDGWQLTRPHSVFNRVLDPNQLALCRAELLLHGIPWAYTERTHPPRWVLRDSVLHQNVITPTPIIIEDKFLLEVLQSLKPISLDSSVEELEAKGFNYNY